VNNKQQAALFRDHEIRRQFQVRREIHKRLKAAEGSSRFSSTSPVVVLSKAIC
jgi:hypothetical protein